ncbi:adenosylmethionine--8-amino-7-oxononanoate transaminase [Candidatus Margulisiibacteriota bacterium]
MKKQVLSHWDKLHLWKPFTQMADYLKEDPLIISHAKGNYLYDIDGNKYFDGVSSLWTNVHGHRVKKIDNAIKKQLKKVAHTTLLGPSNIPAIQLAKKLVEITPKNLTKVFYSDSGSTAVEIALKMAFQARFPNRALFLSLTEAYHGDTIGSVSVGGIDLFHKIYKPLLFKTIKSKNDSFETIEKLIKKNHKKLIAVIMEPLIQGAAGMLTAPKGFLKHVRNLCTKYNILMIVDEVATGFGRTGKLFACEHENVQPDFLCLAKGLSGGYLPLAATLTTKKVFDKFKNKKETFFHGHTYTGNPIACASALANIEIFEKEKIIQKIQPKIKLFQELLEPLKKHSAIKEIRQCGLMIGIELAPTERSERRSVGTKICLKAREYGLLIRPLGNVIVLMPPLSIKNFEIKNIIRVVEKSLP